MHRNPATTQAYQTYYENVIAGKHNNPDFIARWGADPGRFETQILCHKMGTPVPDSQQYEQNGERFGPHRWPYNSDTEPNYSDPPIRYQIGTRLKAIGTSWWDWKNKLSIGLGFDFDSLIDHGSSVGIPQSEINKLDQLDLPWIEIIRSTRGNGRHVYIWFDPENAPITQNHVEHSALARSFLPLLSQGMGMDVDTNVDCKGLIMWIYHVDMTKENRGYELIKPATQILTAEHVPPNWRDNVDVVSGGRSKVRVQGWTPDGKKTAGDELDEMTQAYARVELDETHLKILEALEGTEHTSVWVHDHHLWQGHTAALKMVFDDFAEKGAPLRGLFDTDSMDTDPGKPNMYMRPRLNGGWDVYRFGDNVGEHPLWNTQGRFTHTTFNLPPTLRQVCMACGAFEGPDERKGFLFESVEQLEKAIAMLGSKLKMPKESPKVEIKGRELCLRLVGSKIVATIEKKRSDETDYFPRWSKGSGVWERWLDDVNETSDAQINDDKLLTELDGILRSLEVETPQGRKFDSWAIFNTSWSIHPRENVKSFLASEGHVKPEPILGKAISKSWILVNQPFGPEYPGGRMWNRDAAQFAYPPVELNEGEEPQHPTWNRLLEHCGVELNEYIPNLPWCETWGINSGGDYLLAWLACMIQNPWCKLPYLFMYGPQNCGKSSFHEAISLILTRGVTKADRALTSSGGFNGELDNAILAVVDEVDITKAGSSVYNKLKEWVTCDNISIHCKGRQVVDTISTLHFVQMSNDRSSLPVFPGDTRITAMNVPFLEAEIPRDEFRRLLKEEAPHFLRTLLDFEMQEPEGRLAVPIIETQGKVDAAESNTDDLAQFLADSCYEIPGAAVKFATFADTFRASLDDHLRSDYPNRKIKQRLMELYPVGRGSGKFKQLIIGNISLSPDTLPSSRYVKDGVNLRKEDD